MKSSVFILLSLAYFLSGCVSKRTYQALSADQARMRNDSALLEKRIRQLEDENRELGDKSARMEQALNNRLQEKQDSLNYKEQLLRERELSIRDMRARKEEETEAFSTLVKGVLGNFSGYDAQTLVTRAGCSDMWITVNEKKLFSGGNRTEPLVQELHLQMLRLLEKYPDLQLAIEATPDTAAIKDKGPDPSLAAYHKAATLYKDLTNGLGKPRQRISVSIKPASAPAIFEQQIRYIFQSSLLPCIHVK